MGKKLSVVVAAFVVIAGTTAYMVAGRSVDPAGAPAAGPGGFGGRGGFGQRMPMSVDLDKVGRADMTERFAVVGNLIGAQTVAAVPKISGRLKSIAVRLGDPVTRGQSLAKIEDDEILEQVKQAEAWFEVSAATVRQREADLKLADTNLQRAQNLFNRNLLPQQSLDDAQGRFETATAPLDLSRAQHAQARARLEELRLTLANTTIVSPGDGFVASRTLDPGAWVSPNSSFIEVVDISFVRLVVNVVEKDMRRLAAGQPAAIEVDAYPGEIFNGRVARVAPVLDPATRTAQMEVEIPNTNNRLKPGMYARVRLTVEERHQALAVPANALVRPRQPPRVPETKGGRDAAALRPENHRRGTCVEWRDWIDA